jgi:hypothetical protein
MDQQLLDDVARNYLRVGPTLLESFIEFISLSRRIGDGDMDKLLIMMVVGLRAFAHPVFRTRSPRDVFRDSELAPTLGINSRSLADALGRSPGRPFRRKVAELIADGWLVREGRNLHYTATASRELAPLRQELQRLAVAQYEAVASLQPASSHFARTRLVTLSPRAPRRSAGVRSSRQDP